MMAVMIYRLEYRGEAMCIAKPRVAGNFAPIAGAMPKYGMSYQNLAKMTIRGEKIAAQTLGSQIENMPLVSAHPTISGSNCAVSMMPRPDVMKSLC